MWICDGCMTSQEIWQSPTHYRECELCGREAACAEMPHSRIPLLNRHTRQAKRAHRLKRRTQRHKHEERPRRSTKRDLQS